jgi:hypothetical protein
LVTTADQLRSCGDELERVCSALLHPAPEALDGCTPVLAGATERLAELYAELRSGQPDPEALAEAWRLRRTVRRADVLLTQAARYHAGWSELLALQTAGYRRGGGPGEASRPGRLCLTG